MSNFAGAKTFVHTLLYIKKTLTAPEYIQLRAFARYDGMILFVLWIISFGLYVAGLTTPFLSLLAMVVALITPFMSVRMVRRYRDDGLSGTISFRRAWAYVVFMFFYASLLFAIAQFVYFAYLDKGFFLSQISQMFNEPQTAQALQQMGWGPAMSQALTDLGQMRPIDLALNIMTTNLLIGVILGLPVAVVSKRNRIEKVQ